MKRRSFLKSATIAGAAGSVPRVFAKVAAAAAPRYVLLRADSPAAGAAYRALDAASCADCGAESMRAGWSRSGS